MKRRRNVAGTAQDALDALRQLADHNPDVLPAVSWAGAFGFIVAELVAEVAKLPYGGQAQQEVAADDDQLSTDGVQNPVKFAHDLARFYLEGAGELVHTLATLQMSETTTPYIGTAPVARSALEYAAKSWWLQQPQQTGRERVGRAMGAMRGDFAAAAPGEWDHIAAQLEQWASQQQGFRVLKGESKITAVIRAMHPGSEWQYPYLSEPAHGGPLSVLRTLIQAQDRQPRSDVVDQWLRTWIATGAVLRACDARSRLRGAEPWWSQVESVYVIYAERLATLANLDEEDSE